MAFLCPSRRGRQKKKHKEPKPPFLGRITGSSSVDTLVRVGLEKQHGLTPDARMCVTQDFLATTPGELGARQGDRVYRLYDEGDWVYVITELGQEGFVPSICLTSADDVTKKGKNDDVKHKQSSHDNLGFEKKSYHDSKLTPEKGNPKLYTDSATYNIRSAERAKGFDVSMQADEGSDISSGHSPSLRHQINPLPKPARTQSIPDVISTTSESVNFDKPIISAIVNKVNKTPNIINSNVNSGSDIPNNTKHRHDNNKYNNSNKLYHDRTSQRNPNILELPDRKAGARDSHTSNGDSITEVRTFIKKTGRKVVVVFQFDAPDENDLRVQKGEVVTVLNERDADWMWVKTKNGNEGFVPKRFTCPIPQDLVKTDEGSEARSNPVVHTDQQLKETKPRTSNCHDVRELLALRHFDAQSTDDISVRSGEQVFADLANQIEEDWLWVYSPTTQSYGYIPKDNVRWTANSIGQKSEIDNLKNVLGKPV